MAIGSTAYINSLTFISTVRTDRVKNDATSKNRSVESNPAEYAQNSDSLVKSGENQFLVYNSHGILEEKNKKENTNKAKTEDKGKDVDIGSGGNELSPAQEKAVDELKKIDAEVRAHEAAHMAAGSGLVKGGASFSYTNGPDGKRYAVGGEVSIDISPVDGDPEATIRKMQQVKSAAMAPAEPSSQDVSVAARAGQIEAQARAESMKEKSANTQQNLKFGSKPLDSYQSYLVTDSQSFIFDAVG